MNKSFLLIENIPETEKIKITVDRDFKIYNQSVLGTFLDKYLEYIKKWKIKTGSIFVCDLSLLVKNVINNNNDMLNHLHIKPFLYKGNYYSVEITNILLPGVKILLKEYYHFLPLKVPSNQDVYKYENMQTIIEDVYKHYKIDILNNNKILSAASISNRIFKHLSKDKSDKILKHSQEEYDYMKKSFYGGRVEIYKLFANENYYYDINSLYPFIMKTMPMPIGKPIYKPRSYFTHSSFQLKDYFGFMDVLISNKNNNELPVLPKRPHDNQTEDMVYEVGIIYPRGQIRGIYFSEEIKKAVENGYKIESIFSGFMYEKKEILFDTFVDSVYALRQSYPKEKYPILNYFYKIILNSLYGRFACAYENINYEKELDLREIKYITENMNLTNDKEAPNFTSKKSTYNNMAIASAISAYARCYVYDKIKPYLDHLLYWDTDGIFMTKYIDDFNSYKGSLGDFRLESINDKVLFIATKFYMFKLKQSQRYFYTFRGINVDDFIIRPQHIIASFQSLINQKSFYQTPEYYINLPLVDKATGYDILKTFRFHKKRKYIRNKSQRDIITEPWNIKQRLQFN